MQRYNCLSLTDCVLLASSIVPQGCTLAISSLPCALPPKVLEPHPLPQNHIKPNTSCTVRISEEQLPCDSTLIRNEPVTRRSRHNMTKAPRRRLWPHRPAPSGELSTWNSIQRLRSSRNGSSYELLDKVSEWTEVKDTTTEAAPWQPAGNPDATLQGLPTEVRSWKANKDGTRMFR
jgi:hypothetical protein